MMTSKEMKEPDAGQLKEYNWGELLKNFDPKNSYDIRIMQAVETSLKTGRYITFEVATGHRVRSESGLVKALKEIIRIKNLPTGDAHEH